MRMTAAARVRATPTAYTGYAASVPLSHVVTSTRDAKSVIRAATDNMTNAMNPALDGVRTSDISPSDYILT